MGWLDSLVHTCMYVCMYMYVCVRMYVCVYFPLLLSIVAEIISVDSSVLKPGEMKVIAADLLDLYDHFERPHPGPFN